MTQLATLPEVNLSSQLGEKCVELSSLASHIAPEGKLSLYYSFCFGQPLASLIALGEGDHPWEDATFITGMTLYPYDVLKHPAVKLISGYYCPVERALTKAGCNVDYLPREFHGFFPAIVEDLAPGWVATTTTPMDDQGFFNLGVTGDLTEWFIQHKRVGGWHPGVLVEVNDHMPHVMGFPELGNHEVHISEVEVVATGAEKRELPELASKPPTKTDLEIARHVEGLVEDGATIQIGIGRLPDAIGACLEDKRDLGFHTEMLTDCVKKLVESGAVTGTRKNIRHPLFKCYNNTVVFSFAGGHRDLYDWLDYNPETRCVPLNYLNDPAIIRLHDNYISINNLLACDLRGQTTCTAYSNGTKATQITGIGGQATFVRAAQESRGGKSIQVLNSTRKLGGQVVSNIVPTFPAGTPIGTPEYFTDYIVTEIGIARLRGLSLKKRALALIKIAHPDFQDELARYAEKKGIL